MSQETKPAATDAGPVDRQVRPAAWWHKTPNGNFVCWTSAHAESLRLAKEVGFDLAPLYDQAALDAAVAAERERCEAFRQALLKCKTCALPTEVRDLVNAALRA